MAISGDPRLSFVQRLRNLLVPVPQAGGLLAPEDTSWLQRQGIQQLGAGLLQGGAPSANQRGTLANLGASLQGLDIPGAIQSAARMRMVTQELQDRARARQAYEDITRKYPAMPGENAEQRFTRLSNIVSDLALVPGSEEMVGNLSRILAQLRQPQERGIEVDVGDRVHLVEPGTGRIIATYARGERPGSETSVLKQKAQAGANTAIEAIDEAERLLSKNTNADILPLGAALARGAKTSGGIIGTIAGAAEPLAQRSMTPDQQEFQAAIQRMVHSMVGLLPGSRQSIVLFNSLVNAYTPQPNESPQTRTAKRQARLHARTWLDAIRRGEQIPLPPELGAAGVTPADIELPTSASGAPVPARPTTPPPPSPPPSGGPTAVPVNPRWWRVKTP